MEKTKKFVLNWVARNMTFKEAMREITTNSIWAVLLRNSKTTIREIWSACNENNSTINY